MCARQHENLARVPECHRSRAVPAVCRQLLDTDVFARCTGHLNPQYYVESCKDDMCECPTHKCYCDSFAAYARECKRQGVELASWKAEVGCDAAAVAAMGLELASALSAVGSKNGTTSTVRPDRTAMLGSAAAAVPAAAMTELQVLRGSMGTGRPRAKRPHGGGRKQQQKFAWGEEDFMSKHIPKTFLADRRPTGRTPPPIH